MRAFRTHSNRFLSIALLGVMLMMAALSVHADGLIINEVMVANNDLFIDPSYNYGGWIELYNPTEEDVKLTGYYITDGTNEYRLSVGQGTVTAGGYKTMWFDHNALDGNYGGMSAYQVRFKLKPEGGSIMLTNSSRAVVDSVAYPPCVPRCSYARLTDGADQWGFTSTPSPTATNNGSSFSEMRLEAPEVDTDSRLFTSSFRIKVTIPTNTTLRYTTDGSTPTATHGETSRTGVFTIDATSILRFCLVRDGYLPSPVVTRSYIYENHPYYLPVISIATKPDNFYNDTIGIYVKGTNGTTGNGQSSACNWNRDWERPVNIEYLTPSTQDGTTTWTSEVNQELDLEICGGWTRAYGAYAVDGKSWPMHASFRVKTDKRYEGINEIACPVFPYKPHQKYRCWQVRNGGNVTKPRIIDAAIQQIVLKSGFYVDCQDYQPAHVFFNGEYFGMLNIRESNNKHYGYSNYGIDTDDMDQFDLSNSKYNQKVGTTTAWTELLTKAKLLKMYPSKAAYQEVKDRLCIDEFINYMALELYMGASDWITNTNNIKGFRCQSDNGKFHFVLFDTDSAFSGANMLSNVLSNDYGANVDDLFRYLMSYPDFVHQFIDAFCLVDGSVFEPTRCKQIVQDIYDNINPAIQFEGNSSNTNLATKIQSAYNSARITNMASCLSLDTVNYVTLAANTPQAVLMVNGQQVPTGRFAGNLYCYNNLPVNITAKAPAGYIFRGWSAPVVSQKDTTLIEYKQNWLYYDQGSMDGMDWKSPSFDATSNGWKTSQAPFGYANDNAEMLTNSNTILDYGGVKTSKRPTYYFRNSIKLDEAPDDGTTVTFNYQVDDGLMLYVNGNEVEGYYVKSGSSYNDYTTDSHYEGTSPHSGTITIPNKLLRQGDNCIAVEVKNTSASSSDIFFDASISVSETSKNAICSEEETIDITQHWANGERVELTALFDSITDSDDRIAAYATPIRINEVSAGGDIYINEFGKRTDWVELYNTTDEDISLAGMYLSDDPFDLRKFQFTEGVVPAHGTCIVWCDGKEGTTELHAPFKLDNSDGAYIGIQAEDGSWNDGFSYQAQPRWQTYGRFPDGGCHLALLPQPTIDHPNKLGTFDYSAITPDEWDTDGIQSIPAADDDDDDSMADIDHGDIVRTLYYNMSGQQITRPQSGIYIRKDIYTDGTQRSRTIQGGNNLR